MEPKSFSAIFNCSAPNTCNAFADFLQHTFWELLIYVKKSKSGALKRPAEVGLRVLANSCSNMQLQTRSFITTDVNFSHEIHQRSGSGPRADYFLSNRNPAVISHSFRRALAGAQGDTLCHRFIKRLISHVSKVGVMANGTGSRSQLLAPPPPKGLRLHLDAFWILKSARTLRGAL